MRKLLLILLTFCVVFTSACEKIGKPMLLTNSQIITRETVSNPVYTFSPRQRINYVVINPKGFSDTVLRLQIIKKDEKTANWGISIYQSENINVEKGKKFYIGYTTLPEKGCYIMRVFELNNIENELARNVIWIQ